jgi:hypothetical protein
MPIASWLFVRGSESIWIERPFGTTLIVAGPAHCRQERTFITEKALQTFQIELAEDLSAKGWFLCALNSDRRQTKRSTGMSRRRGCPTRRPSSVPAYRTRESSPVSAAPTKS